MKNKKKYLYLILYLISFLIFYNFPFKEVFKWDFLPAGPEKAEGYGTQLELSMSGSNSNNGVFQHTNTVIVESAFKQYTIYTFGPNTSNTCYQWTRNTGGAGGTSWDSGCLGMAVWYDKWTPGITDNNIHKAYIKSTDNDVYYRYSFSSVNITGANQGGTFDASSTLSITKGYDGTLYVATSDDDDSFVLKCSSSCTTAANWTEAGTNPMDLDTDEVLLRPLSNNNIMLINWDISADMIRSKIYNASTNTWDADWQNIATAVDNTTFRHAFETAINMSNYDLLLCANNNVDNAAGSIITGIYNGTSWSTSTADVITATQARQCAIGYDQAYNEINVVYLEGSGTSYTVYAKKSSDNMATWSTASTISSSGNFATLAISLTNSSSTILFSSYKRSNASGAWYGSPVTPNLTQCSYRWKNDNNPPDNNTNMANGNTATSTVSLGQRLTAVFHVNNEGPLSTTTILSLQFTTGSPTASTTNWTDVDASTAISYSEGGSTNGTAMSPTFSQAGTCWSNNSGENGKWHEATSTTVSMTFTTGKYQPVAFMIHTANAAENTTYYLRLYNYIDNRPLATLFNYPTLTTVSSANYIKRYSKATITSLPTNTSDLTYYLDYLGYYYVSTDNNGYDLIGKTGEAPMFMFVQKNSNSTDQIDISWNGQFSIACDVSKYVKLQVYNFTDLGWEDQNTNTTCSAGTDFDLTATISSSISSYYSSNWTYWRIYQNSVSSVMRSDYISFTFSTAGALSLTAPSSVTFTGYVLSGTGINQYTYATGTEQIVAADSGIGSGWILSGTATNWVSNSYTIDKGMLKFRSDGATSTEPSLIFSNQSYLGISEGTDNQNFSGSVTLMSASGDEGVGIGSYYFRPTFDLYISSTSTYAGSYVATMTLTLAYQSYFESLKLKPSPNPVLNYQIANKRPGINNSNNLPLDFRRLAIKTKVKA